MARSMRVVAVGPWDRPGWAAPLQASGIEVVEGRSIERFPGQPYSEAELIELVRDADAVLVSSRDRLTRPIIEACPNLRIIAKATIGVEVIDLDAATEHGIVVCNSPALENLVGVAEGAVAQILALLKRVRINERLLRAGQWRADERLGELLWGKTVGIVGLGRIGSNVARRLQTWDVRLLAADPYVEPGHAASVGVQLVPLDELMAASDAITVHVNLTAETRGLISEARLRSMRPTAYLVNSSRGPVVDEGALCRAIREGWIAGAALDVFEQEPLRPGNPILDLDPDRVILTPHCIGANRAMRETGTQMAVDNMLRALRGELPRNVVNPEAIGAWTARFVSGTAA
jgi:D-3-phosphoglycerate dehydrogenase